MENNETKAGGENEENKKELIIDVNIEITYKISVWSILEKLKKLYSNMINVYYDDKGGNFVLKDNKKIMIEQILIPLNLNDDYQCEISIFDIEKEIKKAIGDEKCFVYYDDLRRKLVIVKLKY